MVVDETSQLPSAPSSAGAARRIIRRALSLGVRPELVETATLLVSELVSNAIIHARTQITLRVRLDSLALRIEVADENSALPRTKVYSEAATTGRGLRLVDELADRWGVELASPGKVVWFELAADPLSEMREAASPPDAATIGRAQPASAGAGQTPQSLANLVGFDPPASDEELQLRAFDLVACGIRT